MNKTLLLLCIVLIHIYVVYGQPNPNCAIIIPPLALTATAMQTPWRASTPTPAAGPCNQSNPGQTSFVQGAIINLDTGAISIYNPLVIDLGATPFDAPTVAVLPANYVAAYWFGTNAGTLTLLNTPGTNSLQQAACVNGGGSAYTQFGQFAYCNALAFYDAARIAIGRAQLVVPPIGVTTLGALAGAPCPTTRSFQVVDQDQSDNVVTTYLLVTATGKIAQDTAANRKKIGVANFQTLANGSDNRLVAVLLAGALGCTTFHAPDLADPGAVVAALPLNELQAAVFQGAPVARCPSGHAMALDGNGNPDINKLNAYRAGNVQVAINTLADANQVTYCQNMYTFGPNFIIGNQGIFSLLPSPDPANTNTLFSFLVSRFNTAVGPTSLNCVGLLNLPSPLALVGASGATLLAGDTVPTLDSASALQADNPATLGLTTQAAQALCSGVSPATVAASQQTVAAAAAPGFQFQGASFGIGIGAGFGALLVAGLSVLGINAVKNSASRERVRSDFTNRP